MSAAAAKTAVTADEWTAVAVDGMRRVIEPALLAEFFADPVGTFNSIREWPGRLMVIRGTDLPPADDNGQRMFREPIRRSDVLWDFDAEVATAPDTEFAWKRATAIAAAANSTKPELPSGPTGGY